MFKIESIIREASAVQLLPCIVFKCFNSCLYIHNIYTSEALDIIYTLHHKVCFISLALYFIYSFLGLSRAEANLYINIKLLHSFINSFIIYIHLPRHHFPMQCLDVPATSLHFYLKKKKKENPAFFIPSFWCEVCIIFAFLIWSCNDRMIKNGAAGLQHTGSTSSWQWIYICLLILE